MNSLVDRRLEVQVVETWKPEETGNRFLLSTNRFLTEGPEVQPQLTHSTSSHIRKQVFGFHEVFWSWCTDGLGYISLPPLYRYPGGPVPFGLWLAGKAHLLWLSLRAIVLIPGGMVG